MLFLFLLAPSALPLPTGGLTQVLEAIAMLLALQLIANRDCVWLPRRWEAVDLGGRQASTNFKLIPVTLRPFGRDIVSIEEAEQRGLEQQVTVPASAP